MTNYERLAAIIIRFSGLGALFYAVSDACFLPRYVYLWQFAKRHKYSLNYSELEIKITCIQVVLHVLWATFMLVGWRRILRLLTFDLSPLKME